ncbi:MAG: HIT family protein [Minisyncoccia bacterium]
MQEKTVFEKIIAGEIPSYKVYEDENVLAFLAKSQRTKGHTLVVPKVHSRNILDITENDLLKVMAVVRKLSKHIYKRLDATGLKIRQNNESDGGQEVFHTHFHIIPRYKDDTFESHEEVVMTHEELVNLSREIYLS